MVAITLAAMIVAVHSLATAAPLTCVGNWSDASSIVAAQNLSSIEILNRRVEERDLGRIVTTTLCHDGKRYIYRLIIQSTKGGIRALTVDAKQPFAQ